MINFQDKLSSVADVFSFSDASLQMIILLGAGATAFLLILLKLAFITMKRADKKAYDSFLDKDED